MSDENQSAAGAEGGGGRGGGAGDTESLRFEEALARLEQIIARIESGEAGLEDALAEYERGVGLIRHCRGILDRSEQRIEDLTKRMKQE